MTLFKILCISVLLVGCASNTIENKTTTDDMKAEEKNAEANKMPMEDLQGATGAKLNASKNLVKDVLLNEPANGNATYALAKVYLNDDKRVPAILALSRSLILSPKGKSSSVALKDLKRTMDGPVSTSEGSTTITLGLSSDKSDVVDGDFTMVNTFLALKRASRTLEENKDKSPRMLFGEEMAGLFSVLQEGEDQSERKGFVWEYYVPYFVQLHAKGYTETFIDYIHQLPDSRMMGMQLDKSEKFAAFEKWSNSYKWPTKVSK
ncbi:MAG: hypothetical protein ACRBF0_19235 [Calditrichia bacterium]